MPTSILPFWNKDLKNSEVTARFRLKPISQ